MPTRAPCTVITRFFMPRRTHVVILSVIGIGKRACGQEQFSVEAAGCRQWAPIWKRGLELSLVQDHAGLAQPTDLI
jgi:hypothetical protein